MKSQLWVSAAGMMRRLPRGIIGGLLVLGSVAATPAPNLTGYPNSMAAPGDSITRAYNTGTLPFGDAPGNSWSTGTRPSIESHYLRILDAEPAIFERNFNDAVSGAKMADLASQVTAANQQGVAYVTILVGANDLCTRTVAGMTSVNAFRTQFEAAMAALSAGSPRARLYVVSIPNVYRLWVILKENPLARATWSTFHICQSLLADPRSTDTDDIARRRTVRQRTIAFNAVLDDVCALYIHCRFDDGALFEDQFTSDDVSRRDYFHPSIGGQKRLARITWGATFDFTDQIAPISTATVVSVEGGLSVSLDATDDVGLAGIEYRSNLGPWQRYGGPLFLATGDNIRFRAVDVNGNIEATQSLTA
jgi:lysophospholipase L1-like esterase